MIARNSMHEAQQTQMSSPVTSRSTVSEATKRRNSALLRIAELNNEGAEFLERGELRSAAMAFNEAFMRTKKYARKSTASSGARQQATERRVSIQNSPQQRQHTKETSRTQQSQQQEADTNQASEVFPPEHNMQDRPLPLEDEFLIYSKPIRFDTKSDELLVLCPKDNTTKSFHLSASSSQSVSRTSFRFDILSIVITFNVAITQHVNAIRTSGPKRKPQLVKALAMYDLCHTKRSKCGISWDLLYSMGLINNIGLIHYELGNEATSGRFFEFLLSMCIAEQTSLQPQEESMRVGVVGSSTAREQLATHCPIRDLFRKNAAHVMVMTQACAPMA